MANYPNNSFSGKDKRENKAVVSAAESKEPSFGMLILKAFLPEDINKKDIKTYIAQDVIGTGIKDLVYNLIVDSLHMRLYGTNASGGRNSVNNKPSYQNYYERGNSGAECTNRKDITSSDTLPDLCWKTDGKGHGRAKAETVLATMRNTINQYKMVTVADLLDFSDRIPTQNDFNLGWTNLDNAKVIRNNDGSYSLSLPTPRQID